MKDLGIKCLRLLEILSYIIVAGTVVIAWAKIFGMLSPTYWTWTRVLQPYMVLIVLSIVGGLAVWYLVLKGIKIVLVGIGKVKTYAERKTV